MDKLTIGLIIILVIAVGVGGFLFGSQNNQGVPITLTNNTTNDSGYSDTNIKSSSKNNTKTKTNSTVKKNETSTNSTNSTKKTNSTNITTI
ncbi:MAG: hypothetical protein ACPK7O_07675 [Methanobacterium sp.]